MANCFNAILATIGKTPIAQVKRLALNVIQQAEREGSGMLAKAHTRTAALEILAVLRARTPASWSARLTIPRYRGAARSRRCSVACAHIGGATETLESFRRGELQARPDQAGSAHGDLAGRDFFELLPNWLHKR